MPLRLHAFPASEPSRAVAWFLKANGITEVGYQLVNLFTNEHLSPEFYEKTPYQFVPILELEDGSFLTESGAILNYLASFFNKRADYPTDLQALARIHEAELHHDTLARQVTRVMIRPILDILAQKITLAEGFAQMEANKEGLINALVFLNTLFGARPFIAGKDFTVVDYLVACELSQLPMLSKLAIPEEVKIDLFPNIAAYLDRVRAHSPLYDEFLQPFEHALSLLPK